MGAIHNSAATGYDKQASSYVAGRPSYHPDIVDAIALLARGGRVIDLGAGTGISTVMLVDRGLDVVAVEPVDAMRAALQDALPTVTAMAGTASSMPVDDASASLVLVGQAFHWFDHGPALDEISRVLVAGGSLVTLWNVRDHSVSWVNRYTEIIDRHQGDTPRHRTMDWRRAIEADERFALDHELRASNPHPTSSEGVVDRVRSTSFIAALDDDTRSAVEDDIRDLVAPLGKSFDYPYVTEAEIWTLTDR